MAKVTNFLSISLLVSVLAVSPMFAAGVDAAAAAPAAPAAAAPAAPAAPAPAAPAAAPAVEAPAAPAAPAVEAPAAAVPEAAAPAAAAAAAPAAPAVAEPAAGNAPAAVKFQAVFNFIDHFNPFEYGANHQANYPTLAKTAKYLTVLGLVASNSAVQSAVLSLVAAIQNACGAAEDDADQSDDSNEPSRLVIGRA